MRAYFLIAIICLSVVQLPVGSAQIPTASISLTCDSDPISVEYLYEIETSVQYQENLVFAPSVDGNLYCTISNPTAYTEKVEIVIEAHDVEGTMVFTYQTQHEIGGNSEKSFNGTLTIFPDFISVAVPYSDVSVTTSATVKEISGIPPANVAESNSDQIIVVKNLVKDSIIGMDSYGFQGQVLNQNGWMNLNYSEIHSQIGIQNESFLGIQFMDIDCYDNQTDDEKQPSLEHKNLYMHWNNTQGAGWSHFSESDVDSDSDYTEELANGVIDVDLTFGMDPTLAKRIYMDSNGLFKGSFDIYVEGDWTNDNDGNTACGQNDCEELNITLMAGSNEIGTHHETGLVQGQNTVVFNFVIEEDTIMDWDGDQFNPEIRVKMKLRGNYQSGGIFFADSGEPAKFEMTMGIGSRIELPISNNSLDCDNKVEEMKQWSERFNPLDITNQEPNVLFLTSVSNLVPPSNTKSEIQNYRQANQHTHLYIDDLNNENIDAWDLEGGQNYVLVQPNGKVAWTSFGPSDRVVWSEINRSVSLLQTCIATCQIENAITELIDVSELEIDTDNDGVPDMEDVFPYDSNETADSDGDGVGDNEDAFPQDANETHDDDSDGVGNNSDVFPQDGNETNDDDGDGVGNNTDAFPQDANETIDTDGDGVGDNADPEPENPDVRTPQDLNVEISDRSSYLIAGAIVFLGIVILFVRRKQPPGVTTDTNFVEEDSIWNDS